MRMKVTQKWMIPGSTNNEKNGNEEKIKGIIKEVVPTYKNKSNK